MKPTITFKFEKFEIDAPNKRLENTVYFPRESIGNKMMENQEGFRFSQVVESIIYFHENNKNTDESLVFESFTTDTKPYIIPVPVQYNPIDWCDVDYHGNPVNKKSVFELIHPIYLKDLQEGNAILMIDQSVEGYSLKWLWSWFHQKCTKYSINPEAIIYLTGDQSCVDRYTHWCLLNDVERKIKVIPSMSLSTYLHKHYVRRNLNIKFDEILDYKRKNKNDIYLYDCINMRPRVHRILNFLHLINSDLLDKGNISMSAQNEWDAYVDLTHTSFLQNYGLPADIVSKLKPEMTPKVAKHNYDRELDMYYHYVERILDNLYKNSWVSLVTESSYFDHEYNVFISEKTFKPIAAMQPFIILGSKNILRHLRNLGFKTFSPYIDESYSSKDDGSRIENIMNAIKKIQDIPDKVEWFESMRDPIEHNHNLFLEIGSKKSKEHIEISNYYFEYFKDKNV